MTQARKAEIEMNNRERKAQIERQAIKDYEGLTGIFKCTNCGELWLGQKLFIEGKCYNFTNGIVIDELNQIFNTGCETLAGVNYTYKFQFEGAY